MTEPDPQRYVVIGSSAVASQVCATLVARGNEVAHIAAPDDSALAESIGETTAGIAVLTHDDVAALRYALACSHVRPTVPLVVTIFDRTIAEELRRLLPDVVVTSPAALAAPLLAGPCISKDFLSVAAAGKGRIGSRLDDGVPVTFTLPPEKVRFRDRVRRALGSPWPRHDAGIKLLVLGALGLIAVLIVDWVWLVAIDHEPLASSFLAAVSIVATVGPAKEGEALYAIVSALGMLLAVVFTAMFTAGIVDRQLGPKLVGLLGDRTIPRKDHVIVVGLGQVGLRLCVELRSLGIPVVGVERDADASNLRLAPSLRIPTVIGHGTDRGLLASLGSERARAIAAVGSDDLDNVAVAVAAHAVAPRTNVVLRAGEQEAIAETRSLLPLGTTRDVTAICAGYISAHLVGERPGGVVQHADEIFLWFPGGETRSWAPRRLLACRHFDFRSGQ